MTQLRLLGLVVLPVLLLLLPRVVLVAQALMLMRAWSLLTASLSHLQGPHPCSSRHQPAPPCHSHSGQHGASGATARLQEPQLLQLLLARQALQQLVMLQGLVHPMQVQQVLQQGGPAPSLASTSSTCTGPQHLFCQRLLAVAWASGTQQRAPQSLPNHSMLLPHLVLEWLVQAPHMAAAARQWASSHLHQSYQGSR
jgi:hypothetical protein